MRFLPSVLVALAFITPLVHGLPNSSENEDPGYHGHGASALVAFYKKVYEADSSPEALTFEEAISPNGVFYTNGVPYDYDTYNAISKRFNRAYRNAKMSYSQIVEVPKANGTDGEGTVGASVQWRGDYIKE